MAKVQIILPLSTEFFLCKFEISDSIEPVAKLPAPEKSSMFPGWEVLQLAQ
jgi:hypothetical protein